jgi:hypothetical protein
MIVPDEKAQPIVVVIDDDPDVRDALQGLLRAAGLRVETFASVQEFLESSLPISRVPGPRHQVARTKRARISRGAGGG